MKSRYLIVIERAEDGSYSAYVPDLPGCVSCADTVEGLKASIREAIEGHLATMREEGLVIPEPSTVSDYVEMTTA